MDVTIIETGAQEELSIIDPKTGIAWTKDLLGNYDALPDFDEETGTYKMSQEDFNWWSDLIDRYQAADDRFHELLKHIDNDRYDELLEAAQGIDVDLENYPEALQAVCDDFDTD
jgi:hypothetical protein